MAVQQYLNQYFWTTQHLAEYCGLALSDLNAKVEAGLVPKPSYVVTGPTLESAAFGQLPALDGQEGSYFNPATVAWIGRAQQQPTGQSEDMLKQIFMRNMAFELAKMNQSVWRLSDSFNDEGVPILTGLNKRIESYWQSLNHGIFGLCVANPVSESEIALKEILQEKLTAVTNNGLEISGMGIGKNNLILLIRAYAAASMPFSPVEYPISSRKRLVDDLLARCVVSI